MASNATKAISANMPIVVAAYAGARRRVSGFASGCGGVEIGAMVMTTKVELQVNLKSTIFLRHR